jgi:hypothetical protein
LYFSLLHIKETFTEMWDVTPYSFVDRYCYFGGIFCLSLQGEEQVTLEEGDMDIRNKGPGLEL